MKMTRVAVGVNRMSNVPNNDEYAVIPALDLTVVGRPPNPTTSPHTKLKYFLYPFLNPSLGPLLSYICLFLFLVDVSVNSENFHRS